MSYLGFLRIGEGVGVGIALVGALYRFLAQGVGKEVFVSHLGKLRCRAFSVGHRGDDVQGPFAVPVIRLLWIWIYLMKTFQ